MDATDQTATAQVIRLVIPPAQTPVEQSMPVFTWEQLHQQLVDLTDSPEKAAIVGPLVSGLRKQAASKSTDLVLREVLCLAWTLMDESFRPGLMPGEEADMP